MSTVQSRALGRLLGAIAATLGLAGAPHAGAKVVIHYGVSPYAAPFHAPRSHGFKPYAKHGYRHGKRVHPYAYGPYRHRPNGYGPPPRHRHGYGPPPRHRHGYGPPPRHRYGYGPPLRHTPPFATTPPRHHRDHDKQRHGHDKRRHGHDGGRGHRSRRHHDSMAPPRSGHRRH